MRGLGIAKGMKVLDLGRERGDPEREGVVRQGHHTFKLPAPPAEFVAAFQR